MAKWEVAAWPQTNQVSMFPYAGDYTTHWLTLDEAQALAERLLGAIKELEASLTTPASATPPPA